MPSSNLPQMAMDDIEDDDDEDEVEAPATGAKGVANTWGQVGTSASRIGNTVVQQGVGRFGNVAGVANLAQTGSYFSAASTGVSAALAPVAAVTGPIGIALALVDSAFSAKSAISTWGHIIALEVILEELGHLAMPGTKEAVLYACKKKNKKLKRKGLGCIPIFGSICNTVYTAGRTIQKRWNGTKGLERRKQANVLWGNALKGDRCAKAACRELLGIKIYTMIEGLADGDLVLKKKMKSL